MAKKENGSNACCVPGGVGCRVEAVVSIDERGQMVLPKGVRERMGVSAGDRLALIVMERDGKVCCLSLIKADDLNRMVKDMLGPMLGDMLKE